ncbi:hypothetical protein KCV01_g3710, partial [Aureobasidium melanogenum]
MRSRCGTTRPTKPITPENATAAPTDNATSPTSTGRNRSGRNPSNDASPSPSNNALSAFAALGRQSNGNRIHGATMATLDQLAPPRLPKVQNVRSRN